MDFRPLRRPKHLVLTLSVALVAGSTLALAAGDVEPAIPPGLGAPLFIPLPAVGDHGDYAEWRSVHAVRESGAPYSTYGFNWDHDREVRDGGGALVWANVLHNRLRYPTEEGAVDRNETQFILAGTNQVVAEPASQQDRSDVGGDLPQSRESRSTTTWFSDDAVWAGHPCLRNSLQGQSLDLAAGRLDGFHCPWLSDRVGGLQARIVAVGGQPGSRDVLLHLESGEFPTLVPTLWGRAWFREGNPYPIRIEDLHGNGTINNVVVLQAFHAGTEPLRGQSAPLQPPHPLTLAPVQPWGLDETGVMHPFPLSAAFAAARDNPDDASLRDFLTAHPTAYTSWGQFTEYRTDQTDYRWDFGVTDGTRILGYEVHKTLPGNLPGPLATALAEITVSRSDEVGLFDGHQPLPGLPPPQPTVASLFEHWRLLASPDFTAEGANTWSFQVGKDPDGQGGTPGIFLQAGHLRFESQSAPGVIGPLAPVGTQRWLRSTLAWYDDAATASNLWESTEEYRTDLAPSPQPPVGNTAPVTPAPATVVLASTGWFELDASEVAALSLGTVLVSLAYYLWPLAKGGLVGLFSRLQRDDLLENPLRQQLVQRIEADPGIHHNALVRDLAKGKGTVEHHLHKLVEARLVLRHQATGYTCYFPAGTDRRRMAGAAVTKADGAQRILQALAAGPRGTRALASMTGLSPSTVSHHLARLRAAGLVQGGGTELYHAAGPGTATAAEA